MSDNTSRRDAVNEFGIPDEHLVDRRRFLARLGGMSALGASFLALGNTGTALARGLARTPVAGAARPIYMLSLGDSIMWGQGLAEPQKFRNIVEQWIRSNNPERRDVVQLNYTHSGASLGYFPFGSSGMSSRALRLLRARAGAKVDPTGSRDLDPSSEDAGWPDDSAAVQFDRRVAAAAAADQRPYPQPSPEEKYGGEIPRANPILWRQMDMAVAGLKARNVAPEDVDLVLMDGGANDVDFAVTVANGNFTPQYLERFVGDIVGPRIEGFLPWALKTFPNAKFVVTGYYPGVSAQTPLPALVSMVAAVKPLLAALGVALPIVPLLATPAALKFLEETVARGGAFERATSGILRRAVERSNGRAIFVSPEFQPEHAYGAPQTLMFRYEDRDPAMSGRVAECHSIYAGTSGGIMTPLGPDLLQPEGMCAKAATFHPNPAGARRYADRIIAALPAIMPMVDTASRSLKLTVQGEANGAMKTVTVTAVDAATGQPVAGTVSINGARGATGAPVTFRACVEGGEPVVTGAKGTARRPITPRGGATAVACTGSVTAQGYPTVTFEY